MPPKILSTMVTKISLKCCALFQKVSNYAPGAAGPTENH